MAGDQELRGSRCDAPTRGAADFKCVWLHGAPHSVVTAWLLFAYQLYVLREEVLGAECLCGVLDSATGSSTPGR
jgi:hypothetical protein